MIITVWNVHVSYWSTSKKKQSCTLGLFSKPIRNVEQPSQVRHIVTCFREKWSTQSALKEEENCQRKFCCCTKKPAPHTAANTLGNLRQLKWETMWHPADSLDLVPSHFHLYSPLKTPLREGRASCESSGASVGGRSTKNIFCWWH